MDRAAILAIAILGGLALGQAAYTLLIDPLASWQLETLQTLKSP